MTDIKLVVLSMLWLVALWRLPSAIRVPRQRALWAAFTAIAAASTLGLPTVMHSLDSRADIHNLSTLGKNLLGIVGSASILEFVITIAGPATAQAVRRLMLGFAATAMLTIAVSFAVTPRLIEVDDFYGASAGSVPGTTYCVTFLGYLAIAMAVASWFFWSYSRHTRALWLRTGLRVLGIGTTLGTLYGLFRTAHMLTQLLRLDLPGTDHTASVVADGIENLAIGLIIIGNSIPAAGVLWHAYQDSKAIRRIRPLWVSLTQAVPSVILDRASLNSPRVRLHRLVIEIRDAALLLTPYVSQRVHDDAYLTARQTGLPEEQQATLAAALWLRTACQAKLNGAPPAADRFVEPLAAAEDADFDFEAEVRRLQDISTAYHSPLSENYAGGKGIS